MLIYPYVSIATDQVVVHVVNYVKLVHNLHLNIANNQVDIEHKYSVVNIVRRFFDRVSMLH